jgi:hypothetical protein
VRTCLILVLSCVAAAEMPSTWRLSTSDTAVVVGIEQDRPVLRSLGSAGAQRNWLAAPVVEVLMPVVELDGNSVKTNWKFQGAALDPKKEQLTLRFTNANPRLTLLSIWRARPGRGPVEHWLEIANESGTVVTMSHQESLALSGLRTDAGESASAWWMNRGASDVTWQGGTMVEILDREFDQVLVSNPQDGSSPVPWIAVQVGQKRGLYAGWEFSGIGNLHVRTTSLNPLRFDLRVGLPTGFKTDLGAGETFLVPPAFIGCYEGDIDEGSHSLHRFILKYLLPGIPAGQSYPTLAYNNYFDSGGAKGTEQDMLRSARHSKDLGFETFMVDGTWHADLGDWRWHPQRFPNGGKSLVDFVHGSGIKFGLRIPWTNGGKSTHPEALSPFRQTDWFVLKVRPDYWGYNVWGEPMTTAPYVGAGVSPAGGPRIDLGYAPARAWAKERVPHWVSENRVDLLKHDSGMVETECAQTNHRHRYGTDVSYWAALGYYEVQESLLKQFPDLALEGCSAGGHLKDFGSIQRNHYLVPTDTLSALPDRKSIWESTFAFPPAVLMTYTCDGIWDKIGDRRSPYLWRSGMMSGWQVCPSDLSRWTPEQQAALKRSVDVYKSWIRPILRDAKVHHILPRPDGYHWDGMFYWSQSLKRGTVYIFRPNNDELYQRVRLKGLVAAQRYKVRSEDRSVQEGVHSGAELMNAGLRVKLPGKYTSDLIYLEDAK